MSTMREYVKRMGNCLEGYEVRVNSQNRDNVEFYVVSEVPATQVAAELLEKMDGRFGYIMDDADIQWYTITPNGITPFCSVRVFDTLEEMEDLYHLQFKEDEQEFVALEKDDEDI